MQTQLKMLCLGTLLAFSTVASAQTYGPQDEGRRFNDGSKVVCKNVEVQRNSKDPNRITGTAIGAVAGGLIGNQVDKRHVGGRVVNRTERQCHTETATSESTRVTGYNVTYRNEDGTTGTMRMASKPGTRIAMGTTDAVTGYNVTYRYDGVEKTVKMDNKPASDRLPVVDGQLVTQTASVAN